jgi:hypothetical protein
MRKELQELIDNLYASSDEELVNEFATDTLECYDGKEREDIFELGITIGCDSESIRIAKILQEILDNDK